MNAETYQAENLPVGKGNTTSDGDLIKQSYKANFFSGDKSLFTATVASISGCSEGINDRIRNTSKPLQYTMKVQDSTGQNIEIWNGVILKGIEDKYLYVKGARTNKNIRWFNFDIRNAFIFYIGQQYRSPLKLQGSNIILIEVKDTNLDEHSIPIQHELTEQARRVGCNRFLNRKCGILVLNWIARCVPAVIAIGLLYWLLM